MRLLEGKRVENENDESELKWTMVEDLVLAVDH